jgi:hypothetical protein
MAFTLPTARRGAFIVACFALSTLLTGLFIRAYGGYVSPQSMLLSGSIASGKWAIQMVVGIFLLEEKRWHYLSELAVTCLVGSVVLLPYAIFSGGAGFFFGSLAAAILAMSIVIIVRLSRIGLSWRWTAMWFLLLAIAVSLQLTVVFDLV